MPGVAMQNQEIPTPSAGRLVAQQIFLRKPVGRDRQPCIARGFGFLKSDGKKYFFHISEMPLFIRQLIDLRSIDSISALPDLLPQLSFQLEIRKGKLQAVQITPTYQYENALIHCGPVDGTSKISIAGLTADCHFMIPSEIPEGAGFYVADVYPAIGEVTLDGQLLVANARPFIWQNVLFDNLPGLKKDSTAIEQFLNLLIITYLRPCVESFCEDPDENWAGLTAVLEKLGELGERSELPLLHIAATELESKIGDPVTSLSLQQLGDLTQILGPDNAFPFWKAGQLYRIQSLPALVVDVESDGEEIREIAFKTKDTGISVSQTEQQIPSILDQLSQSSDGTIWIGHNIKQWDMAILKAAGLTAEPTMVWDTIRIEALLDPLLAKYSLKTTHQAVDDVALTWKLFTNQIMRFLLSDGLDENLLTEIPADLQADYLDLLRQNQGHALSAKYEDSSILARLRAERDEMMGIAGTPNSLKTAIVKQLDRREGLQFILHARPNRALLRELPHALLVSTPDDPGTWYVDLQRIEKLRNKHSFSLALLRRFLHQCQLAKRAPLVEAIPDWILAQITTNFKIHEFATPWNGEGPPPSLAPADCRYIFCSWATFLGLAAPTSRKFGCHSVIALLPELFAVSEKSSFGEKPFDVVATAFEHLCLRWQFSGGQSYSPLFAEQRAEVARFFNVTREDLETRDTWWLEKTNRHSVVLWGSGNRVEDIVSRVLPEATFGKITYSDLEVSARNLVQTVKIEHSARRSGSPDTIRLNPETRYRDRYWSQISFALMQLTHQRPSILWLANREEIEPVTLLMKELGFSVPAEGSVSRRIELLLTAPAANKLLIMALADFTRNPGMAEFSGLQMIFEALPIGEQWVAQWKERTEVRSDPWAAGERGSAGVADATSALELDIDDEDNGEEFDMRLKLDPSAAMEAISPWINQLLLQLPGASDGMDVIILDPRLPGQVAETAGFSIRRKKIPGWGRADEFSRRLQVARQFFHNVQPDEQTTIAEDWLSVVEGIFIDGYRFREDQKKYLERIITRAEDILVTLPTGGGKSVLFQAPALYRGLQSHRLTLVVSPLKALMVDQAEALWRKGFWNTVDAVTGDMTKGEIDEVYRRLAGGEISMLFVAPERFRSRRFVAALQNRLDADGAPEFWVFDEAHCISQWGLDFRPDYLHAVRFIREQRSRGYHAPAILLSATITEQVFSDLQSILK